MFDYYFVDFCFVRNPLFGTNAFHFNGFFTTIYNVYNGATLGAESKIIYGTYGYLFLPLYKILGLSLTLILVGGILFSILSVYALSSIYVLKESELCRDFINRQLQNNYDDKINQEINLLNKYAENGTVNYIGNYSAGILLATGLKNNFLGEMALCWYSWDDHEYIEHFIESCEGIFIIDQNAYNQIETYMPNKLNQIMVSKGYYIIDGNGFSKAWGK